MRIPRATAAAWRFSYERLHAVVSARSDPDLARSCSCLHIQFLNPESLGKPLAAYSNLARVRAAEFLFIAGQVGMDKDGKVRPPDFEAQCALRCSAISRAALASQGANFANVVAFTSYLVHAEDIPKFAQYRAREFPRLFAGGLPAQHAPHRRPPWCARSFWSK